MALKKFNKIFLISIDSDAVFHEESEYVIGFKTRAMYDILSSIFRKKCFFYAKKSKKYSTCISMKTGSKSEKFITKMISVKSSTNPESFIGFGRGHRMDLARSHGYTRPVHVKRDSVTLYSFDYLTRMHCLESNAFAVLNEQLCLSK